MKNFYILSLLLLTVSCKKNDEAVVTSEMASDKVQAITMSTPPMVKAEAANLAESEVIGQKIIKEGNLRFETDDLTATRSRIVNSVRKYQGIIQNDVEGKDDESLFRNIIVRVPSNYFDNFMSDIGQGVAYFDRKEITATDVTEEYIDIDARLKAKKMLEERYLELLKKASKVTEMLEIEKQLATIREEIEAKEGQLRYMQSRISMSTVSIEFYKKTALEGGVTVSYGSKMWNAIKSGFNGISAFFIGVLYMWPFIIILVVLIYFLRRRMMRKKTN